MLKDGIINSEYTWMQDPSKRDATLPLPSQMALHICFPRTSQRINATYITAQANGKITTTSASAGNTERRYYFMEDELEFVF